MSLHKVKLGADLIDALATLGVVLGYHVEREFSVRKPRGGAVDVAWMKDSSQRFPLMIFEVETAAGNTIANNAIKVFGQPTNQFEKPLFFFHLVLKANRSNSRVESLATEFGTNNYRIYRLNNAEKKALLNDIVGQHRRLTSDIDLIALHDALSHKTWDEVNLPRFFDDFKTYKFEANYLSDYARMALMEEGFWITYVSRLLWEYDNKHPFRGYDSYLGDSWSTPVHLALLANGFPSRKGDLIVDFVHWQTKSSYMSQIGPHFGLSRDYDQFVLSLGAGFFAVLAALFQSERASAFIGKEMETISNALGGFPLRLRLYHWVWLLHVSSALEDGTLFELVRCCVNEEGGVPKEALFSPSLQIASDEECEWDVKLRQVKNRVPDLKQFIKERRERYQLVKDPSYVHHLGLMVLISQDYASLSEATIRLLATPYGAP